MQLHSWVPRIYLLMFLLKLSDSHCFNIAGPKMPDLTVLLPREIRVTREERERLVLCATLRFQHDREEGAGRGRGTT